MDTVFQILGREYDDGVFCVNESNGYLPKEHPLRNLPPEFAPLQELVEKMPVWVDYVHKQPGYLAEEGLLAKKVAELPNLVAEMDRYLDKPLVIQAFFRSYAYLTSAYLLEPAYHASRRDGRYGKANTVLPAAIAQPFVKAAERLNCPPFMQYHYSANLGNYYLRDPTGSLEWTNLSPICTFSGLPDEAGFLMVHNDIDSNSGAIIGTIRRALKGLVLQDATSVAAALKDNCQVMRRINERRKEMWTASSPSNYDGFRIFLMGITGNEAIFGDGVVYQGCFGDRPQKYRGSSAAQDDIIPTEDSFLGIVDFYPKNDLTEFLIDIRRYRPIVVQDFIRDLRLDCRDFFTRVSELGVEPLVWLLWAVQEIYRFRNGHWMFVQKFILEKTPYKGGTGGTPITSWIPNQIEACLAYMAKIIDRIESTCELEKLTSDLREHYAETKINFSRFVSILEDQVAALKKEDIVVELIYHLNSEFKEV